nr:MAG TPA: hypothetical protein [Caudoviricetes sp.]
MIKRSKKRRTKSLTNVTPNNPSLSRGYYRLIMANLPYLLIA